MSARLLTPEQVAEYLGVAVRWVRDHSRGRTKPQLLCFKVGKYWRYRQDDIEKWLEGLQANGSSARRAR